MRAVHILRLAFAALLLASCAAVPEIPAQARQALAPSGKLRIGVYVDSPISLVRDPRSGESHGIAFETGRELARRLGVPFEVVEFPRVAEVLAALKQGNVDVTVTNATEVRAKEVDFSSPLLLVELGYLVPPGSKVTSIADADRPGVRIGITQGSTTSTTLPRVLKNAALVPAPSMKRAIEMLGANEVDAFATNKANLFEMSDAVKGSRVLEGNWGTERMSIAIPQGRDAARPYLEAFVAEARRDGFVAGAVQRAGLRGTAPGG